MKAVMTMRAVRVLLLFLFLGACASTSTIRHDFGFDMRRDDQDAVVLEYRYGRDSAWIGHRQGEFKDDRVYWFESAGVDLPHPEFLYVKWRNRSTGQVFDDRVDLGKRLPHNIEGQKVYFMIHGSKLYVYLITRQPRPAKTAPNGPSTYSDDLVITIYPDSARF